MDITQNVFLAAFEKLHSVQQPDQFKSWLMRVTYNSSVSFSRSQRAEPHVALAEEQLPSEDHPLDRHMLGQYLDKLHPKHRLAVVLKYIEGYAVKEIAEVLECHETVVKNILYRSMRKMADVP